MGCVGVLTLRGAAAEACGDLPQLLLPQPLESVSFQDSEEEAHLGGRLPQRHLHGYSWKPCWGRIPQRKPQKPSLRRAACHRCTHHPCLFYLDTGRSSSTECKTKEEEKEKQTPADKKKRREGVTSPGCRMRTKEEGTSPTSPWMLATCSQPSISWATSTCMDNSATIISVVGQSGMGLT
ncbi:MAG: hypothetical protein FRX49_00752 [Trebouxia sp. A1-2]|nr:MAG: hypothetical protein FRX49_00752 [Trebouxia sp. A1-2]